MKISLQYAIDSYSEPIFFCVSGSWNVYRRLSDLQCNNYLFNLEHLIQIPNYD